MIISKIKIHIEENPAKHLVDELDSFSKKHWDELSDSGAEDEINFFDKPSVFVYAKLGEQFVGVIFIFIRKFIFDSQEYTLGGLGGVLTHKQYRHMGIASLMLKEAMNFMKYKGLDISMLCTDIEKLACLYEPAGFVPLGRPYFFYNKNGQLSKETEGMIAPINSVKAFETIKNTPKDLNVGMSNF